MLLLCLRFPFFYISHSSSLLILTTNFWGRFHYFSHSQGNKLKPRTLWRSQNLNARSLTAILNPLCYQHLVGFAVTLLTSSTVGVKSQTGVQRWLNFLLRQIRKKTAGMWQYPKSLSSSGHKRRVSSSTGEETAMLTGFLKSVKKSISWNNKCWRECGGKGILLHSWWAYKLVQPLWKTVWKFLKKL